MDKLLDELNKLKNKFLELQAQKEQNEKKEAILKNNNQNLDRELSLLNDDLSKLYILKTEIIEDTKKLPETKKTGYKFTIVVLIVSIIVSIIAMSVLPVTKFLISLIAIISGTVFAASLGFSEYFEIKKFLKENPLIDVENKIEEKQNIKKTNRELHLSNTKKLEKSKECGEYLKLDMQDISNKIKELYVVNKIESEEDSFGTVGNSKQKKIGAKKQDNK